MLLGFSDAFGQGANCGAAVAVNVNTEYTAFSVTDATVNDPTEAAVNGQTMQRDGWFSFVSNGTEASIRVVTGNRNPMIFAYSGACGGLTLIGSVNAITGTGGHTEVLNLTGLTNGVTYYVRVGNSTNNNMALSSFHILTNDRCSNAFLLTSNTSCTTTSGSTLGATDNNETGDCTTGTENAVWYQFQAVATTHTVTVVGAASFDPVLQVLNTCGVAGNPTGGACVDVTGDGGTETRTLTGLTIGNFYKIQIHDFNGDLTANAFTICVTHTPPPTITSLGAASGCEGSSLVITGTNLTGATAVTIGGTAATITGNTATTVTVTVGTGTTGTVQVTTPGGTATSAATFTVNPLPANPGNPTSNSPQCNPPGVTLTRVGTPPVGVTWYWQTTALGTSTANSGATFIATTSGTYYLRAQNDATGCWSAGSGSTTITINTVPATVATPTPANAATGVCYAGAGAVSSISWGAAAGATSYDVYFGAGSVPGTVTANVATNTYNTGALAANTTYYWRVVAKNACGDATTSATFSFTTAASPCILSYCPAGGSATATSYITNVTLNTINQNNSAWGGYRDYYPTVSTNVIQTLNYNISVTIWNNTTSQKNISAWIDWNQNGVFDIATETVLSTTSIVPSAQSVTLNNNFTVPAGAALDATRLRVELAFNSEGAAAPCNTNSLTDVQDYKVIVNASVPCATPTAQPTALVLTPAGNFISGSFAPAVPSADGYLIVMNTTNVAPTPVNGTTYIIGNTIGAGNTVVGVGSGTTFVATGLTPTTTYYFFVYSLNNLCTGGPLYNTTSPLNGTSTTTTADPVYCTPSVGVGGAPNYYSVTYFTNISFVGTLNDVSNNSTYSSAPRGYQDFTTLPNVARQAQGQGVNISTQTTNRGYLKAWVDWNKDGDFLDAGENVYDVGGIASYSTTFGFVIPGAQPVGNYRIRIRINKDDPTGPPYDAGAISTFNACQNIDYYGETEDYIFTVVASCSANITAVFDGENCGPGSVVLGATGSGSPTQYRWYTTEYGGTPVATTATGSWTTPALAVTTTYWVTAFNGCESLVRTKVVATISPLATLTFTPSVPEVCGENNVLSLTATGDKQLTYLINEPFNAGLGVMTNTNIVSNGGAIDAISQWQGQTSTFVPSEQVWFPAIASGLTGNGFAMATSDTGSAVTHNAIMSPVINSTNYLNLTMSFDIYYSRYYVDGTSLTLDYVTVDVSTNGGGAWTELARYTADIGYGTRFENKTFSLNGYINQSNLRVRVRYYGEWCDGLAIDNFKVFGDVPLNTSFDWTSATPVAAFQDFACTTPYVAGTPITTVYIRPTLAQLEEGTYDFTATATLSNGCDISQNISIENKSKVWKGGSSNDWNNPNNWLPLGVPDANTCVIVPSAFNTSNIIGTNYNAFGKTLQVKDGGTLIVHPSNTVTITDYVEVSPAGVNPAGVFTIENSASLIQVNNAAVNTGNITMKRNVNLRKLDYVYWSTPVANFALNSVSPGTTGFKYKWTPTIATNTNGWGNWAAANETMVIGKGYIVRGPDAYTSTLQNFTANFFGVPNNGIINMPISRGTYDGANYSTGVSTTLATKNDDNWNLIGNPYPSAVNANTFLATNTNIAGFIKYWTHGTLPSAVISDPFYNNYGQNYTVADYITYNATGANPAIGNGNIAAGQGFFVLMNHTSAATTENVVFNNSMRRNDYRNDLFYRNENETNAGPSEEKHRIWLNLISPSATSSTTLIGYIDGATNDLDRMYDAPALDVKTNFELYSFSNTDKLTIQGKSLPFNNNDQIHLGVRIPQNGTYTIGISTVDGLFESASQDIYLEDKVLNVTHNLRSAPYSFTATSGSNETRFVLKFTNETLGNEDFTANAVTVYTNESINVNATNQTIKSVRVHDLLGRVLGTFNNVNASTFATRNVAKTQSPLLVEVTLENGSTKTYKVIF